MFGRPQTSVGCFDPCHRKRDVTADPDSLPARLRQYGQKCFPRGPAVHFDEIDTANAKIAYGRFGFSCVANEAMMLGRCLAVQGGAGDEHGRARSPAFGNAAPQFQKLVEPAAHVSNAEDPMIDIVVQRVAHGPHCGNMGVHVPQPGHDILTTDVDSARTLRSDQIRLHRNDAIASYQDVSLLRRTFRIRVHDEASGQQDCLDARRGGWRPRVRRGASGQKE
jgi:hypothetical protein